MDYIVNLPSGWRISLHMSGIPMKVHNVVNGSNETKATVICKRGQRFSIDLSGAATRADGAVDKRLSPDRKVVIHIDGEWMGTWLFSSWTSYERVVTGKTVGLDEVRPFVFDRPCIVKKDARGRKGAAGTIVIRIEGCRYRGPSGYVPMDTVKRTTVSKKKAVRLSSLVSLANKVPSRTNYFSANQTAYDRAQPFWTVTFHYHTQAMFDALFFSADEVRTLEKLAREHGADNPIEID